MQQDLLPLRDGQRLQRVDRCLDEPPLEGPPRALPFGRQVLDPPHRLFDERAERLVGPLPQTRQEPDQHVERLIGLDLGEQRSRLAALDQHRPALLVVGEEANGTVAVAQLECLGLVLGLAVGEDQLEDGRGAVLELGAGCVAGRSGDVRLAEAQPPLVGAVGDEVGDAREPDAVRQTGVGHRYAPGRRFASDGSFVRISRRRVRSSSAAITVCSSGA